jgi:choline dehydrogenase-like flavoprotein
MIIDTADKFKNNIIMHNSICIIGSGIGASSLAIELFEANIPFIMIEAGSLERSSSVIKRENTGLDFGLRTTTSIEIGGTSNLWHGVLSPLDKIDFEKREWIPNSGWPIKYDDLEPFYQQAGKILNVANFDYFTVNKLSQTLLNLLADLKFNKNILKNKIFQQPVPVTRFKKLISSKLKNSKKQHLYYNACALELVEDKYGSIEKLICGNANGEIFEVFADKFIVCAGALETPRLLLNSSIDNKNIGKYLMDHPMGNLCQISFKKRQKAHIYSDIKFSPNSKIKSGLEFTRDMQENNKLPNHCFYTKVSFSKGVDNKTEKVRLSLLTFRDGGLSLADIWNLVKNFNLVLQILIYKLSLNLKYKYSDLFFVTEQIPNANSTVTLSSAKDAFGYPIASINWQLTKNDVNSMQKVFYLLKNEAFVSDYIEFTHSSHDLDWENVFTSAAHHVGTARMSDSAESGVVDKNLKVFGINNLYVCDGSVFTTSGNVNSSFTISALACRLASHLIKGSR